MTIVTTFIYGFTVDGINYSLSNNQAVVKGLADKAYSGELVIPDNVVYNGNTYPVTEIWFSAFEDCTGITSVSIGNSVEAIYDAAFRGCSNLASFNIPSSTWFIGEAVFKDTAWNNSLPDGLIYKDNVLFGYKGEKPEGHLSINEGTRVIAPTAFIYCFELRSIYIPNTVTSIMKSAFFECNITSLTIPASVSYIGRQAFESCMFLTAITVEAGNTKFDSRNNCNAIIETETNELIVGCQNTIIPQTVTAIGEGAFSFLFLKSITIPNSITAIGARAFEYEDENFKIYSMISEPFPIPGKSSGWKAPFSHYDNAILYVLVGTKAKYEATEGWKDFKNIVEMTPYDVLDNNTVTAHFLQPDEEGKVEIPATVEIDGKTYTVTEIAADAFKDNKKLTEVTIPGTVTTIGDGAFAGCENLWAIYVFAPEPISLTAADARSMVTRAAENVPSQFEGIDFDACTLYVPIGSEQKYREAKGWKLFTHIVGVADPSGITTIRTEQKANMTIYNLSGQQLATPLRGLNIIGGKKVVVK